MTRKWNSRTPLVALLCLGMAAPHSAWAMAPSGTTPQPVVNDVALGPQGTLNGQVVDAQGIGLAAVPVSLRHQGQEIAVTTTGQGGSFQIAGVRGGTYEVASADGQAVYRLWSGDAAPPAARPSALIIAGQPTVRGQNRGIGQWVLPALAAGGIIAGVAVAVSDDDDDPPASP